MFKQSALMSHSVTSAAHSSISRLKSNGNLITCWLHIFRFYEPSESFCTILPFFFSFLFVTFILMYFLYLKIFTL